MRVNSPSRLFRLPPPDRAHTVVHVGLAFSACLSVALMLNEIGRVGKRGGDILAALRQSAAPPAGPVVAGAGTAPTNRPAGPERPAEGAGRAAAL